MQTPFDVGWNDFAYGVNNWTPHDQWAGPVAWAQHMREVAQKCNGDYVDGVLKGIETYLQTGVIVPR